jgi:hypothetical protein
MLIGKEFTVVPDNIENDVQLVTLYSGKCNMNTKILEAIVQETNFNKVIKHFNINFNYCNYLSDHKFINIAT